MNAETPSKVLHVIPGFGWNGTFGGAERTVYNIVRGLAGTKAYTPTLCALRHPAPPDDAQMEGCEILTLDYDGPDRDFEMLTRCSVRLRAIIKRRRPAIVHSHLWPAAAVSGCALKGLAVPHVVHIHDTRPWLASSQLKHRARRAINRWLLGPSAHFIACANSVRDYTAQHFLPSAEIRTVYYGIDSERPFRRPDRASAADAVKTIGTAARLRPEKGLDQLISACRALRDEGVAFRLKIAGGGALLAQYRERVREAGLADCIQLLGFVTDIPSFLSGLDVFVLSSTATEGLPIGLLEAMASRLPVVASSVAGIPEAVTNGEEGFLIPPGDVPALCAALKKLVADPTLARDMGLRARARIERSFMLEHQIHEITRCYNRILGRPN